MKFIVKQATKLCRLLFDIFEIYIPAIMLGCLFISFIIGVIYRYILKNPQPWTFELSSISFLWLAVLSWCFVERCNKHIVFDMMYEKMSKKTQCVMRILSSIIIFLTATILIYASIEYIDNMLNLKTQVMKWPRYFVFLCFPIALTLLNIRIMYKLSIDIRFLINGYKTVNKQ